MNEPGTKNPLPLFIKNIQEISLILNLFSFFRNYRFFYCLFAKII